MGLIVTTGIWALFVALALWPKIRSGGAGGAGFAVFLMTMTLNEIPLVLLAVFVVSMAVQLQDVTLAPSTWPAVGLAVFVVLGLIWLQARAAGSGVRLAAAVGLDPTSFRSRGVWLGGIVLPFERRRRGVRRLRNLQYGPDSRAHRLDVYRGAERTGNRPILIHLHGGGFFSGGKSRDGVLLLNQLAAHGWLCLSADYRLRTAGAFPNPLVDTKRVIAWAREHASEYGADPDRIILVGASAGGHLAVSAALTHDRPELQPGFADRDTTVSGVVVLYGFLGPRTADPASSPVTLIRPDAPPMLIIHGANDTVVPPAGPHSIATALQGVAPSSVISVELPHAQHSFDLFASVRARMVANAVEAFLDRCYTQ